MHDRDFSKDEFDAKWMALRARFIARLPERMAEIGIHWAACANGDPRDALKTLFHITHSLAGSGATFGFDQLSRAAREAETSIESAMTSGPPLDGAALARTADALRQLTLVAASLTGSRP